MKPQKSPQTTIIRERTQSDRKVELSIFPYGRYSLMISADHRPPMSPDILLTMEEGLKLANAILAAFPLDAMGRV